MKICCLIFTHCHFLLTGKEEVSEIPLSLNEAPFFLAQSWNLSKSKTWAQELSG